MQLIVPILVQRRLHFEPDEPRAAGYDEGQPGAHLDWHDELHQLRDRLLGLSNATVWTISGMPVAIPG
ncbi:MAG: hypothetical protein AAGF11_23540, partial [Myxococcota bacterium]